jgi:hypothetical protein
MLGKLKTIKNFIIRKAVNSGLIRKNNFMVNGRSILLTNINKSNLLKEITLNGFESYENEVVTLIKNYPWKIGVFVDVGSNIGFYSMLTEIYHQDVKVIAVEPLSR